MFNLYLFNGFDFGIWYWNTGRLHYLSWGRPWIFELWQVRGLFPCQSSNFIRYQKNLPLSWSCKYNHAGFQKSHRAMAYEGFGKCWTNGFHQLPDAKHYLHLIFLWLWFRQLQQVEST